MFKLVRIQCFQKIMDKVTKKFEDKETKDYLLQKAGHLLEPLNFWDFTNHTLDDWQVNVIQKVKEKKRSLLELHILKKILFDLI